MANFLNRIIAPFVRRNKWSRAQQQQHYKRAFNAFDHQQTKYGRQMVPSATEMEDVTTVSAGDFQQQVGQLNSFIYRAEPNKIAKLQTWRDMAMFPEISFALGEIEDEAVNFNAEGDFIELIVNNPRFLQNENILKNISKEWSYIIEDVMNAKHYINEWFMEYMIDGEIFFEKVVDPVTAKDRGILRVKRLRPDYTFPIWEEIESDRIFEFIHKNETNILRMPPEMVAYANSGIYKYPDRYTKEVTSYLETAKVDYRKLKQLEDALVIYRLVRAPERRVFKIEVGKLPKAKAEQYVQALMKKYRQRKVYDPATGEASQLIDTMAMVEDFWLPSQDGKGSSIDTLPGGENLGQIDDVIYFLKKLYRALRIPMSRMEQDTGFSLGDTSDITREEVRFHKMIQKFVNRFSQVFVQIFISHLRLKGYADEYGINEKDFTVKMVANNLFQDFMESEILTQRAENFERFIDYAEGDPDTGSGPLFSKKWLMKRFLKFNDKEILENEEFLKQDELNKKKNKDKGDGEESLDDLISGEAGGGDLDIDSDSGKDKDKESKSKGGEGLGDLEDLNDPDAEPKDKKKDKDKGDDIESFA
jgi:hypothetical protein